MGNQTVATEKKTIVTKEKKMGKPNDIPLHHFLYG